MSLKNITAFGNTFDIDIIRKENSYLVGGVP